MTGGDWDPRCSERLNEVDWQRAHAELERLARTKARLESEEGHWLLCAARTRVHVELGYASFTEYVARLFGYDARSARERLRVAEALEELPELGRALSSGQLCWSAVRELTRVATAETEAEWLEAARGKTSRELERDVSGRKPGDRPADPAQVSVRRHVLRFEVSAETLASVREALSKLRRDSGSPLDDDAALLLMARQVLGGPTDEGRASYQMLLGVCEQCGRAQQQARGELIEPGPEAVDMARCDAQYVRAPEADSDSATRAAAESETHVGHGHDAEPSSAEEAHVGHGHDAEPSSAHDTHVGHRGVTRARSDAGARVCRERDVVARGRREPDVLARSGRSLPHAVQDVPARPPCGS
ncbi:MAG: hypothetical protein JW940_03620 [Polyangiaceae bacterium]|nr:hypothetical protein [Polyangiaceae bacterium]